MVDLSTLQLDLLMAPHTEICLETEAHPTYE
jgi:hypothetical protein